MMEEFNCSICLHLAENAVETSCCHHVFCESCLYSITGQPCPQCRQSFEIMPSHLARRIIGNIPAKCRYEGCAVVVTRSEIKTHEAACPCRAFKCPCPGCAFIGNKSAFVQHLVTEHENEVVRNADQYFKQTSNVNSRKDRITTKRNLSNRESRLGDTGKYYCGGMLGGPKCACCNDYCGPGNGCNCSPCQRLDVAQQRLPRDWYVNRKGGPTRKSSDTGLFYCGRNVLLSTNICDGFCGPTNGPNCEACRIMQDQIESRYKNIWS